MPSNRKDGRLKSRVDRRRSGAVSQSQKELQRTQYDDMMVNSWKNGTVLPRRRDVPKMFFNSRGRVYTFTTQQNFANLVTSSAASTLTGYEFDLSSLINSGEFIALFDQWRIEHVTLTFTPVFGDNASIVQFPIYTVLDFNDASPPASVTDLQQYDTLMIVEGGSMFSRSLKPQMSVAAYSGVFTSFSSARNWIDTASPGVQWYGVRLAQQPNTGGAAYTYLVTASVVVQFRNNK